MTSAQGIIYQVSQASATCISVHKCEDKYVECTYNNHMVTIINLHPFTRKCWPGCLLG